MRRFLILLTAGAIALAATLLLLPRNQSDDGRAVDPRPTTPASGRTAEGQATPRRGRTQADQSTADYQYAESARFAGDAPSASLAVPGHVDGGHQREAYDHQDPNPWTTLATDPTRPSTFSIDVDTASYSNVRDLIRRGSLPPAGAVRVEEFVNYFDYDYPTPPMDGEHPFAIDTEVTACPWQPGHRLLRVGLAAARPDPEDRPAANLVFLIDVSGSMGSANKLPLLIDSFEVLLDGLEARDRVSLVTYAGNTRVVLPSTEGDRRARIREALRDLRSGGSTNGAAGIELAYREARSGFIDDGINRVILATDGDFNVGTTSRSALVDLVRTGAENDIELSILGFGRGNLQDATMEELTNEGDGNYAFIDSISEGRRVFGERLLGTLMTVAGDTKIQLFFNPETVAGYRLLGYENRMLAAEDFNDDSKDAGEIGAGHQVTALYEIVPAGGAVPGGERSVDQNPFIDREVTSAHDAESLVQLRLRYKPVGAERSVLIEHLVRDDGRDWDATSRDTRFAAAVAAFGLRLRTDEHLGGLDFAAIGEIAGSELGADPGGTRHEFLELLARAEQLAAATAQHHER